VKDRDKTPRIAGVILIMWYQSTALITVQRFYQQADRKICWLFYLHGGE
jgi:hypothetical protein